jgi:hypothetical protein
LLSLAFEGIVVEGSGLHMDWDVYLEVTIEQIKMVYVSKGIKLCYAVNWTVQNIVMQPTVTAAPGSNIFRCLDRYRNRSCLFSGIFSLGGEHSWRIARSINTGTSDRGPMKNRFYSCIGDNGTVSCGACISAARIAEYSRTVGVSLKQTSDAAVVSG